MSKRQERRAFIEKVMADIESGSPAVRWELWQQCPNTAVRIEMDSHPRILVGLGFAKVTWPDKWDAEEGQSIALHKAAANIWRQMKARNDAADKDWEKIGRIVT